MQIHGGIVKYRLLNVLVDFADILKADAAPGSGRADL